MHKSTVASTPRRCVRSTPWLASLGAAYPRLAFDTARAADPDARLGYNEFGLENDSREADRKRAAVLALLRRWKVEGVPIDYLGVQSHLAVGDQYSDRKLGTFLRAVRAIGLDVYATELDVDDRLAPADVTLRDAAVAETLDRYLTIALPAANAPLVVTWGLTDRNSWLQSAHPRADRLPQRPLPFDASLGPKAAWRVLEKFRASTAP